MQTILITGGSGFLGQNLALRLKNDFKVVLGSRNNKRNFITKNLTGCEVVPLDVCRPESIKDALQEIKPQIIIHAAATKFVDLSEIYPMECVDVNVLGSQNVARAAIEAGVELVVGISTDKASPPVRNTYGMSKSIMERVFCSLGNKNLDTNFISVRYGNVAWSTGSAMPVWKKMHDEAKVIGSTGPDMRRYFFTVEEAVELVVSAIENADMLRGKILSRPMKAAMIRDILNVWVSEFGGSWKKIDGRPGERDDEYLVGEAEIPYTKKIEIDDKIFYVIDPSAKSDDCVSDIVYTGNATSLNRDEILKLITATYET